MGRAENWLPGKVLMSSQSVICHKTLGNSLLFGTLLQCEAGLGKGFNIRLFQV